MHKIFLLFVFVWFLAGCNDLSNVENMRLSNGEVVLVEARYTPGVPALAKVMFNGETVIDATFPAVSLSNVETFHGSYKGSVVSARFTLVQSNLGLASRIDVDIFDQTGFVGRLSI